MPRRSISQRIGDQAEHLAQGAFWGAPNWICRTQSHDFGVDLEAELIDIIDGIEELSGALVKIQVKGTLKPIFRNRGYYIRLKTEYCYSKWPTRADMVYLQSLHFKEPSTQHMDERADDEK